MQESFKSGHRVELHLENIKNTIFYSLFNRDKQLYNGEIKINESFIIDAKINIKNYLNFYSEKSSIYFNDFLDKLINFDNEPYYTILSREDKFQNRLFYMNLQNYSKFREIDINKPYLQNNNSYRSAIDFALIKDGGRVNPYIVGQNRNRKDITFLASKEESDIELNKKISNRTLKHLFITDENSTYFFGYNKRYLELKEYNKSEVNAEFGNFDDYNRFNNKLNYITTKNTFKNYIESIESKELKALKLNFQKLYEVTTEDKYRATLEKIETIKPLIKYADKNWSKELTLYFENEKYKQDKNSTELFNIFLKDEFRDRVLNLKEQDREAFNDIYQITKIEKYRDLDSKMDTILSSEFSDKNISKEILNYYEKEEYLIDENLTIFKSIFIVNFITPYLKDKNLTTYFDQLNHISSINSILQDKKLQYLTDAYSKECLLVESKYRELKEKKNIEYANIEFNKLLNLFSNLKESCEKLQKDLTKKRDKELEIENNKLFWIFVSLIIFISIVLILFYFRKNIFKDYTNRKFQKSQNKNYCEKFYLLNENNLFTYIKSQKEIENIEKNHLEKLEKLNLNQKEKIEFIDNFYDNLIKIESNLEFERELKIDNKSAFQVAIRKFNKLRELEFYEEAFVIFNRISQFIYDIENKKAKDTEKILLDNFQTIRNTIDFKIFFLNSYAIDKNLTNIEKSNILAFLSSFYEYDEFKYKIIKLNETFFIEEKLEELKSDYIIVSPLKDRDILKVFKAQEIESDREVVIRFFEGNFYEKIENETYKTDNFNISFSYLIKYIEGKKYKIHIEEASESRHIASLIENRTISNCKLKNIVLSLIEYLKKLIYQKNINYLPNLYPCKIFYEIEQNNLKIAFNGCKKVILDREVIRKNLNACKDFFQTPEFREKPNFIIENIENRNLIDRQLVYQVAMVIFYSLENKFPFTQDNIDKNSYKISLKNVYMKDREELEELLNSIFTNYSANSKELIDKRDSLEKFAQKLEKIFFNFINPYIAGAKLNYEKNPDIFIQRGDRVKEIFKIIKESESQNFLIQSNKRMGKSTFLSQIEYEIKNSHNIDGDRYFPIYIIFNSLDYKKPMLYNLAHIIYLETSRENIQIFYDKPSLELFEKNELESFIEYIKYIKNLLNRNLILLIDEFELALVDLYKNKKENGNYIEYFKYITDEIDGIYNFLITFINFKYIKDNTDINPFALNNATTIQLPLFSIDETEKLINNRSIKLDDLKFTKEVVDLIHRETNGHPMFIQYICSKIIELKNETKDDEKVIKENIFQNNFENIFQNLIKEKKSVFNEFWETILTKEERKFFRKLIKDENWKIKTEEELKMVENLKDSFLIREESKKFKINIPIIEKWVKENKVY